MLLHDKGVPHGINVAYQLTMKQIDYPRFSKWFQCQHKSLENGMTHQKRDSET